MSQDAPIGPPVDATPAPRPQRRTFEGRFVRLEPLTIAHARDFHEATHGPDKEAIWRYLFVGPFADYASFETYCAAGAQSADPLHWAVIDTSGKAVGALTLMRIDPPNRVIEIGGITFGTPLQRTTGSTEAIYLLARYIFDDLGYRRFEWKCNDLNAPSRHAAMRLGFSYEGLFRQHMIVKGRNRDTAWFAMLDGEWPTRRAAFETWLAPGNFDANGRQKVSLGELMGAGGLG
ncbi:MAG: GNAT family N-acetyltransferase [Rhodoblastus sp.]|nr:GNAT family N-acetyltransferase [Rhodoblastus sp.]